MKGADPDIVYFGDLPTVEAMRAAMVLADTGHLVLANLSAESAPEALELFCAALPEPKGSQRALLARTLVAVLNQRLVVRANGNGRVPAYEVLMATLAVRDILRAGGSAAELRAQMERDTDTGSRTTDAALDALVAAGAITEEVAVLHRVDPSRSRRLPV